MCTVFVCVFVMGQVPNRSNLNTCLQKPHDAHRCSSTRPKDGPGEFPLLIVFVGICGYGRGVSVDTSSCCFC